MDEDEILREISKYKFYHIIQLTDNISTPGNPRHVRSQNLCKKNLKALDLNGKRVLDVGCRDGLFSFIAESMGAKEVIGIDINLSKPAVEFLIPFFKSKVKIVEMSVYDLKPPDFGFFDLVLFFGTLYHLRYPFWALRAIRNVLNVGGHLLIETAVLDGDNEYAMLFCPVGEESPYEHSSCTFFNKKGLTDTLWSIGFETVATEFLQPIKKADSNHHFTDVKVPVDSEKKILRRGVFHSIYHGKEKDSGLTLYWEGTHHSQK